MTRCDRIRADAAGLAALPAGDAEREDAWAHARECPACARLLDEAERLQAVIRDAARSTLDGDAVAPALAEVTADEASATRGPGWARRAIVFELRREARWRMLASIIAVCAAFVLSVALARHRSASGQDRAFALALVASAALLGAASRRWAIPVVAAAPVAALGVALVTGAAGPLQASVGVDCLLTEIAGSAAVVAGAWVATRRGTSSLAPSAVAAGAAAGALGGAAALQLTCAQHAALTHSLVFHVAGVALAAAAAAIAGRVAYSARHA